MFKKFLILIPIVIAASCSPKVNDENDPTSADLSSYSMENCLYVRNTYNQIVSWKDIRPITFYFSKSVPEKWRDTIKKASSAWLTKEGQPVISFGTEIMDSVTSASDMRNVIYWMTDGSQTAYQQGQTITRWTKNRFYDADILINARDFIFYDQFAAQSLEIHLKSLFVHEFGHALGLKHVEKLVSVMYPQLGYLQIRDIPSTIDTTSLNCEYP